MANVISILLQAKDEASSVVKGMTGSVSSGVSTMASQAADGLKKTSLVLAGVGVGLTAYAKSATDYTQQLVGNVKTIARQTGDTVTNTSRLLYVMNHMGVSADDAGAMFNRFSRQIATARDNTSAQALQAEQLNNKIKATEIQIKTLTEQYKQHGDATGALKAKIDGLQIGLQQYQQKLNGIGNPLQDFGIATRNADGSARSFNDILLDVADKFKAMPDGVEKTNTAIQLFGRSGTSMVKVLDLGRDGITNLERQADKLGITLTDKTIVAVSKYVQSQKNLQDSTNSLKVAVGTATMPVLTNFQNSLNNVTQKLIGMDSPFRGVITNVLAFGGPVSSAASATAGFLGNLGSAGPLLKSFGSLLANPVFLAFAAILAAIGAAALLARHELGSWGAVLALVQKDTHGFTAELQNVWKAFRGSDFLVVIGNYLQQVFMPGIKAVAAAFVQNLLPALDQIWRSLVRLWTALSPGIEQALKVVGVVIVGVFLAALWAAVAVLNLVTQAVAMLASAISNVINWIGNLIAWFGNLVGVAINTVKSLITIFANIVPAFKDVVGIIGTVFAGVGGLIIAPFRWAYESVTGLFRHLPDDLGGIVRDAFGNIGGAAHAQLHNLHIPGFATGTSFAPGGAAMLAENGPELVTQPGIYNLPHGSQVLPADQTRKMMGGVTVNQTNHIYNQTDVTSAFRELGWRLNHA